MLIALFPCFSPQAAPVPTVTIGQNFLSTTYGLSNPSIPPDANGAVGPVHFVEFINGSFTPYYKTNGQSAGQISDVDFWTSAGVILPSSAAVTDPRIIYDWASGRWFAA